MEVLLLLPETGGYGYQPAVQHARVQHEGAAGQYGLTVPNPTARVNATWLLGPEDMRTFGEFYLSHGPDQKPFLIDLVIGAGALRQCVAFFDADSFNFDSTSGESYKISCDLQVAEV